MGSSLSARAIGSDRLPEALALLSREARENLLLLDLAARLGEPPPPGEMATELIGAFRGAELVGVAALRPTIAFDAQIGSEALEALLPLVETLDVGLVKSEPRAVERLWSHLGRRRRHRVWVDRFETCYALERASARLVSCGAGRTARAADDSDRRARACARRTGRTRSPATCAGSGAGCAGASRARA